MRTTIDGAGRVVIPKAVRDEAGLEAGSEIEVAFRDGRIEITPVGMPMRLAQRGTTTVIEAEGQMPVLTVDDVRDALERTRR
jgi:AbrB family looped-hinge helix DNA binding protein